MQGLAPDRNREWEGFGAKQEKARGLGARIPDPNLDLRCFSPSSSLAREADCWAPCCGGADEAEVEARVASRVTDR